MNRYIGVKMVNAMPMTRQEYIDFRKWSMPIDENPHDAGYLVEYMDGGKANTEHFTGYVSWSPKDVFERAYRSIDNGMTFGQAVEVLKSGGRVARMGWNGKGMFVYLVPADFYPARTGAAKAYFGECSMIPYTAYLAIKNVDDSVSTWAPSVNDCLSEDWVVIP